MRDEKLIEAMGKIEDSFILEADEDPAGRDAEEEENMESHDKECSGCLPSSFPYSSQCF